MMQVDEVIKDDFLWGRGNTKHFWWKNADKNLQSCFLKPFLCHGLL